MKALLVALALTGLPAAADEPPPEAGMDRGMSLIEEGARLLFEGLMSEMEPALRDLGGEMEGFASNLGPMLRELARLMGDLSDYHPPEMLPNGDIIIRRKLPGEILPGEEIEI